MERSAFGVIHKRETVPDSISPALPASAVKAYDHSRRHKLEALASNSAAKWGGGIVGAGLGVGLANLARRRVPALRAGLSVGRRTISGEKLHGWAQSSTAGIVGGATGTAAGSYSLKRIKENPRYRYRRS